MGIEGRGYPSPEEMGHKPGQRKDDEEDTSYVDFAEGKFSKKLEAQNDSEVRSFIDESRIIQPEVVDQDLYRKFSESSRQSKADISEGLIQSVPEFIPSRFAKFQGRTLEMTNIGIRDTADKIRPVSYWNLSESAGTGNLRRTFEIGLISEAAKKGETSDKLIGAIIFIINGKDFRAFQKRAEYERSHGRSPSGAFGSLEIGDLNDVRNGISDVEAAIRKSAGVDLGLTKKFDEVFGALEPPRSRWYPPKHPPRSLSASKPL